LFRVKDIDGKSTSVSPFLLALLFISKERAREGGLSVDAGVALSVVVEPDRLPVRTVVGGGGRILVDGEPATDAMHREEGLAPRFITDRHPRTFVAINGDTTKLFLCTVDGRQATSRGMNFSEMASFLQMLGARHAVNLDGGGSTTMVVDHRIVNSPSDATGERAVANAIMVIEK
jgi:exopolysaccharide biosynthesis protein